VLQIAIYVVVEDHHSTNTTQMTLIKLKPSYKQLEVRTNRTSFLCGKICQ